MSFTDVRLRRCATCGGSYLPPGGGDGRCSDQCWVRALGERSTRQRTARRNVPASNPSPNERLVECWRAAAVARERRLLGNYRVDGYLTAASDRNDVERLKRELAEGRELVSRLKAKAAGAQVTRSRGEHAPIRPAAEVSRAKTGPAGVRCPHCRDLRVDPATSAKLHEMDPRL